MTLNIGEYSVWFMLRSFLIKLVTQPCEHYLNALRENKVNSLVLDNVMYILTLILDLN